MSTFRTSLAPLSDQIKNAQVEDTFVTDVFGRVVNDPGIQTYIRIIPKYLTENDRSEFQFALQFMENHGYQKISTEYELWLERDDGRKTETQRFVTEFEEFGLNSDSYRGLATEELQQFAEDRPVFIACRILTGTMTDKQNTTAKLKFITESVTVVSDSNTLNWTIPASTSMKLAGYNRPNNEQNSQLVQPFKSEEIHCQLYLLNSDSDGTKCKKLIMHLSSHRSKRHILKVSIWLSTNSGNRSARIEKYCFIDQQGRSKKLASRLVAKKFCTARPITPNNEYRKDIWEWNNFISMDKLKELVKDDETFTVNCQVELAKMYNCNQRAKIRSCQFNDQKVLNDTTNVHTTTSNSDSSEPAPKRRREEVDTNRMPVVLSDSATSSDVTSSTNEELQSFYLKQQFTDHQIITLFNDDRRVFNVHRTILASKSGHFKRQFLNYKDQTSTVINENPLIFALVIDFMYRDKLDNLAAHVTNLFKAAIKFEIPTLKAMTFKHLEQNLTTDNAGTYVLLAMETSDVELTNLMRNCIRHSADNYSKVCSSEYFCLLHETDAEELQKAHRFLNQLLNVFQPL